MTIYAFIILAILFYILSEIFTVLFQITGLSREKARFQVISLMTGTGFTTKESELITLSKIRRKIAVTIMIFGFCSSATIISMLLSVIRRPSNSINIFIGVVIAILIIFTLRATRISIKFDQLIENIGTKILFGNEANKIVVKDSFDKNVIAEIKIVTLPLFLKDKTLVESNLSQNFGITILAVERDKETISNVSYNTVLYAGDTLIVYGSLLNINNVFYKMTRV